MKIVYGRKILLMIEFFILKYIHPVIPEPEEAVWAELCIYTIFYRVRAKSRKGEVELGSRRSSSS